MLTGQCLCGAVVFSLSAEPLYFYRCHCSLCRRQTGTGYNWRRSSLKPISSGRQGKPRSTAGVNPAVIAMTSVSNAGRQCPMPCGARVMCGCRWDCWRRRAAPWCVWGIIAWGTRCRGIRCGPSMCLRLLWNRWSRCLGLCGLEVERSGMTTGWRFGRQSAALTGVPY